MSACYRQPHLVLDTAKLRETCPPVAWVTASFPKIVQWRHTSCMFQHCVPTTHRKRGHGYPLFGRGALRNRCLPKALPDRALDLVASYPGAWAGEKLIAAYPDPVQSASVLGILTTFLVLSLGVAQALSAGLSAWRLLFPCGPVALGIRTALALPVGALFFGAGVLHLLSPADFEVIVPLGALGAVGSFQALDSSMCIGLVWRMSWAVQLC